MQRRKIVFIYGVLTTVVLSLATGVMLFVSSIRSYELCADAIAYGWENCVEYPMLSKELKGIVSEEEFRDGTPEGRLKMYRKLDNLVLDERPSDKFHGSTHGFKSPLYDTLEVGGKTYCVNIDIDAMGRLTGTEIRNFTCHIWEVSFLGI